MCGERKKEYWGFKDVYDYFTLHWHFKHSQGKGVLESVYWFLFYALDYPLVVIVKSCTKEEVS